MKRTIALILFYFGYNLIFGALAVAGYCAYLMSGGASMDDLLSSAASIPLGIALVTEVCATLAIVIHLVLAGDVKLDRATFSPVSVRLMVAAVVLIVGMGCWTNYLTELIGLPDKNAAIMEGMLRTPLGIISIVLLAPVAEEMLFRGGIQRCLTNKWSNPWVGICLASFIFGAIHLNPVQIPFAFVTGMALGYVYWRTGSLLPGIVMHLINNGTSVVLYYAGGCDYGATMVGDLGKSGALLVAMLGAVMTLWSVYVIHTRVK